MKPGQDSQVAKVFDQNWKVALIYDSEKEIRSTLDYKWL